MKSVAIKDIGNKSDEDNKEPGPSVRKAEILKALEIYGIEW